MRIVRAVFVFIQAFMVGQAALTTENLAPGGATPVGLK